MINLHIIIASMRPGRVGLPVGEWFNGFAEADDRFNVRLIDLLEVNLPFMDEPNHPRLGQYTHDHTRAWSETIAAADAYVFVTPEYNHGMPPSLKNAIDYLNREWAYKPVGFVSYGGVSGGTRSAEHATGVVTTVNMMPVPIAVNVPFVAQFINDDGEFEPNEPTEKGAAAMLNELEKWANALRVIRE